MVGGRLGDVFAQYVVMNLGMTLFNASTLVCALVSDRIGLVIGRAFQGKPSPVEGYLALLRDSQDLVQG